ncbi:PRC and DUF2382 domain-containing protein [Microbispora sp. H10836]|uniref:PRC and DUF2382 domain-containing protein n=1 Tax=Microbispora sp. H10836 TaxID=2729106 RepID=UPI001474EC73|nr:PRC and DUF2382 domain-containing protein [Microbispora sp. H10836]
MITHEQIPMVLDHPVYDLNGDKIGEVKHVFLDDATGQPEWLCVKSGLFNMKETFVPLRDADLVADHVEVPYDKDRIKDAPDVDLDADEHLPPEQERQLYRYYDLDWDSSWERANQPGETGWADAGGRRERDRMGIGRDDAMTRSEEQLEIGTERHRTGQARLRKYVVTEHEQVDVPVTREKVRIEREPITDTNRDEALNGPDITGSEHEVTLHEERPVVDKRTVPVERVHMAKEQVTDRKRIGGEVRKERIDVEGDVDGTGRAYGSGDGYGSTR